MGYPAISVFVKLFSAFSEITDSADIRGWHLPLRATS